MVKQKYNKQQKALLEEWKLKAAEIIDSLPPLPPGTFNNARGKPLRDLQMEYVKKIQEAKD